MAKTLDLFSWWWWVRTPGLALFFWCEFRLSSPKRVQNGGFGGGLPNGALKPAGTRTEPGSYNRRRSQVTNWPGHSPAPGGAPVHVFLRFACSAATHRPGAVLEGGGV